MRKFKIIFLISLFISKTSLFAGGRLPDAEDLDVPRAVPPSYFAFDKNAPIVLGPNPLNIFLSQADMELAGALNLSTKSPLINLKVVDLPVDPAAPTVLDVNDLCIHINARGLIEIRKRQQPAQKDSIINVPGMDCAKTSVVEGVEQGQDLKK